MLNKIRELEETLRESTPYNSTPCRADSAAFTFREEIMSLQILPQLP